MNTYSNLFKNRSLVFLIGIIVYLSIEPPINSMQPKKSIQKITNFFMKTAANPLCAAVVEDAGTIATAVAIEKLLATHDAPPEISLLISIGVFLGMRAFSIHSRIKRDPEHFDRLLDHYEEIMELPIGPLGILLSLPCILTQAALL